jgi:hypothetical protein
MFHVCNGRLVNSVVTEYVGTSMTSLSAKRHMPSPSGSSVTAAKREAVHALLSAKMLCIR